MGTELVREFWCLICKVHWSRVCKPDSWARPGDCVNAVVVDFAVLDSWIHSYSEFYLTSLEVLGG